MIIINEVMMYLFVIIFIFIFISSEIACYMQKATAETEYTNIQFSSFH